MIKYLIPSFLITIFPIFDLYISNTEEVLFGEVIILFLPLLFVIGLLISVFSLIYKNIEKGALFATYLLLFFYYFQYPLEAFNNFTKENFGIIFFRLRYIVLFLIIFFVWFFYKILKAKKISPVLFVIPAILFGILVGSLSMKIIILDYKNYKKEAISLKNSEAIFNKLKAASFDKPNNSPDIYFIILDAYASSETFLKYFNYDNSWFIKNLKKHGFFVSQKSFSNYSHTAPSVSATLNMLYHGHNSQFTSLLDKNIVLRFLENNDYNFFNISSSSYLTNSIISNKKNKLLGYWIKSWNKLLSPFGFLFYFLKYLSNKTFLLYSSLITSDKISYIEEKSHKNIIVKQFKNLKETIKKSGPKFVFCHIVSPHPPYVFHSKKIDSKSTENNLYVNQSDFISKKILKSIDYIIKNSKNKPLIILQSDHGKSHMDNEKNDINITIGDIFIGKKPYLNPIPSICIKEIFSCLNAWCVPKKDIVLKQKLYHSISPINTFRLIFDRYFKTNLGLVDDKSFLHMREESDKTQKFVNIDHVLSSDKDFFVDIDFLFSKRDQ